MEREPAIIIGALEAAVISILGLVAVLLELEPDLTAALVAAGSALTALLGAWITRGKVSPV